MVRLAVQQHRDYWLRMRDDWGALLSSAQYPDETRTRRYIWGLNNHKSHAPTPRAASISTR
jgi:hypothetical protein